MSDRPPPSPFELQATSEDDITTRTLGQLAHRPALLRRLVRHLAGPTAVDDDTHVAILFFCRLGENFFREAVARVAPWEGHALESRWNLALGLPPDLRWARTSMGRWVQPAKWHRTHMESIASGAERDRSELLVRLKDVQQLLNTEPDVVLAWNNRLILLEVKVLSEEGHRQLERQRTLGDFFHTVVGTETSQALLSVRKPHDLAPDIAHLTWAGLAELFDDVPEVGRTIREAAFFYGGRWRNLLDSSTVEAPGPTVWDLAQAWNAPSGVPDARVEGDAWALAHLDTDYLRSVLRACEVAGVGPLEALWTGTTGTAYAAALHARPNWMVETVDGRRFRRGKGGKLLQGGFNDARMRRWTISDVQAAIAGTLA